jgi:hypothetical protein
MPKPWQKDETELPGDSDARLDAALSIKEGLPVDHAIADHGDFEGDYPCSTKTDVGADTIEDVVDHYDSFRPVENLKILD